MRKLKDLETFVGRQQLAYKILKKLEREPTLSKATQSFLLNTITTITIIWDRPEIQLSEDIRKWLPHLKHVYVRIRGSFVPQWTGMRLMRKLREYEEVEPKAALRTLGLESLMDFRGLQTFEVVVQRNGEVRALWVRGAWEIWRRNLGRVEAWLQRRGTEGGVLYGK